MEVHWVGEIELCDESEAPTEMDALDEKLGDGVAVGERVGERLLRGLREDVLQGLAVMLALGVRENVLQGLAVMLAPGVREGLALCVRETEAHWVCVGESDTVVLWVALDDTEAQRLAELHPVTLMDGQVVAEIELVSEDDRLALRQPLMEAQGLGDREAMLLPDDRPEAQDVLEAHGEGESVAVKEGEALLLNVEEEEEDGVEDMLGNVLEEEHCVEEGHVVPVGVAEAQIVRVGEELPHCVGEGVAQGLGEGLGEVDAQSVAVWLAVLQALSEALALAEPLRLPVPQAVLEIEAEPLTLPVPQAVVDAQAEALRDAVAVAEKQPEGVPEGVAVGEAEGQGEGLPDTLALVLTVPLPEPVPQTVGVCEELEARECVPDKDVQPEGVTELALLTEAEAHRVGLAEPLPEALTVLQTDALPQALGVPDTLEHCEGENEEH